VGTTSTQPAVDNDASGISLQNVGTIHTSGNYANSFNRTSSNGDIIQFRRAGSIMGRIGSSSSISGKFYVAGDSGVQFRSDDILPTNSSGTYTDGALDIGDSGAKFRHGYFSGSLHTGGGIYIGDSSAANHLDDYEEGTWTPAFVGWSSGLTYNYQHGWYTKIGDVCHVSFYLNFVLSSASGTNLRFNVPFTGKSGLGQDYQGGRLMRASGLTVSNPEDFSFGLYNQTALYLYNLTGGVLNYTSGFQTGIIAGQFTYKTT